MKDGRALSGHDLDDWRIQWFDKMGRCHEEYSMNGIAARNRFNFLRRGEFTVRMFTAAERIGGLPTWELWDK